MALPKKFRPNLEIVYYFLCLEHPIKFTYFTISIYFRSRGSLLVECLTSMPENLGSIPSSEKRWGKKALPSKHILNWSSSLRTTAFTTSLPIIHTVARSFVNIYTHIYWNIIHPLKVYAKWFIFAYLCSHYQSQFCNTYITSKRNTMRMWLSGRVLTWRAGHPAFNP